MRMPKTCDPRFSGQHPRVDYSVLIFSFLGQNIFNNVRLFNSREALVQPLILQGELVVIDAQLVKNRGIHVTNMDRVFDDVVAVIISLTILEAAFYSGASHPH